MSGTSVMALLDRADTVCSGLRRYEGVVSADDWQVFDQTVFRLLSDLAGVRIQSGRADLKAVPLHRAVTQYPGPRVPPEDQRTFSPKEAARATGLSGREVMRRVREQTLAATRDWSGYHIPRSELPLPSPIRPADAADPRPLRKLAALLGTTSDLLAVHREDPRGLPFDASSATFIAGRVLSIVEKAAQHAMTLGSPHDAERPLAIARYAQEFGPALRAQGPAMPGHDPVLPPPAGSVRTPFDALACALHLWSAAAYNEVRKDVPSVAVLRDTARQGVHLYAATDALIRRSCPDDGVKADLHTMLRTSAVRLHTAAEGWGVTTTCVNPSLEYVDAARALYAALAQLTSGGGATQAPYQVYEALRRGVSDVAWVAALAAPQANRLIESRVLFAPAGALPPTVERLGMTAQRRLVEVELTDLPALSHALVAGELAAREVATSFPSQLPQRANATPTAMSHQL